VLDCKNYKSPEYVVPLECLPKKRKLEDPAAPSTAIVDPLFSLTDEELLNIPPF
jgi:hypothetical protein